MPRSALNTNGECRSEEEDEGLTGKRVRNGGRKKRGNADYMQSNLAEAVSITRLRLISGPQMGSEEDVAGASPGARWPRGWLGVAGSGVMSHGVRAAMTRGWQTGLVAWWRRANACVAA